MVHISEDEINNIRKQADIVDIIGGYLTLTKKGQDYKCVCPFHDDHSPSMSVSPAKQIYKCFSCGAAGNVFSFVQNYEQVSFVEAIKIVADKVGYHLNSNLDYQKKEKYPLEHEIMELATKFYQNNLITKKGIKAQEYLKNRQINQDTINEFQIGLSLDDEATLSKLLIKKGYDLQKLIDLGLTNGDSNHFSDVFSGRITFPLWDKDGYVIGFSSRIYRNENLPKYINTKETYLFKKGENLFNYHRAKKYAKNKEILIVEGQLDAIRIYSTGIKNVVALMGTALTKSVLDLLKNLRCQIILCLDNDDAGLNATLKNGDILLNAGFEVKVIRLSGAKDPDEYIKEFGVEAFKKNLTAPFSYLDFKISSLKQKYNLKNNEDVTLYINEVLEILNANDNDIYTELTLNNLSKEFNLSLELLRNRYNSLKKVESVAKEIFLPPKKNIDKLTSLDKVIRKVLYYMMNDVEYINLYQKKLGYFTDKNYRQIANEIVYFVEKNRYINIADFITYTSELSINKLVLEISREDEELNQRYFLNYLDLIKKKVRENKIQNLKKEIHKEQDMYKKMEIAKEIAKIKKEVL